MKVLYRLLGSNKGPKIKVTKAFLEELAHTYNCEFTPWEREYFPIEDIKTIELDRKVIKVNGKAIDWDTFMYYYLLR